MQPSLLDKILQIVQLATVAAQAVPLASPYAALALQIEQIAKVAIAAHEQLQGQPFDASLLKPIDPIP